MADRTFAAVAGHTFVVVTGTFAAAAAPATLLVAWRLLAGLSSQLLALRQLSELPFVRLLAGL